MFDNTIENTIASKIEKEIYQDFEAFIKDKKVYKTDLESFIQKLYLVNYQ